MARNHDGGIAAGTMSGTYRLECIDPEIGEMLAPHAAGVLAGADRQLFAAHLKACARCADEERVMREVARGIAHLRARPDPAAALGPPARYRRFPAGMVLAAALGAVAAIVGWLVAGPRGSVPEAVVAEVRALEERIGDLESQNALRARTLARERARYASSPLAGIPIASPPNL